MAEFSLETTRPFVPKALDNHKKDKPATFILRLMTPLEREDAVSVLAENESAARFSKFVRLGVDRIDDLVVDGAEIKTPEQFMETPGLYDMYIEVATAAMQYNAKGGLVKN